jgi:hypothetical protein
MASTITLQETVNWALPLLRYQPLTIGTSNEPAITSANIILQTILGPPFIWRWNRNTNATTVTVAGTQDYTVALSDFGYFEKATVTDPTGNVTELVWKEVLSIETNVSANRARPTFISTQLDDNAGNITFRLMPVPDQVYTLTLIYQKAPVLFTALSGTWAPIPDYMEYIYTRGFLAFAFQLGDDQRFMVEHQRFLAQLISAAEGLSEMQKNIFLGGSLTTNAQMQSAQLRTQQGAQARGT